MVASRFQPDEDDERDGIHLLVRFSDKTGAIDDTIEAHRDVIAKHGSVWFGKMGRTLGYAGLGRINDQCRRGVATHLYLVQSAKGHAKVYRGDLSELSRKEPRGRKEFVPPYYGKNDLTRFMRLWCKLSSLQQMPDGVLSTLLVARTGSRVSDILHASMAGLFIVKERSVPSLTYHYRSHSQPSG